MRRARLAGHVLHERDGAFPYERDGHRVGTHIPKIREKIGAMSTGQPFKASVLRAGEVIELNGEGAVTTHFIP